MSFIIREAIRYADTRGRNLISTSFALGVVTTALVTLGFLALAGQLHSRKVRARESHPSSRALPFEAPAGPIASGAPIAQPGPEPTGAHEEGAPAPASGEAVHRKGRIRHIEAHRGIPELIHALGREDEGLLTSDETTLPIAEAFALPSRFDRHISDAGYLDLETLLVEVLEETGYNVRPERGDLIATRGDDRLVLRVLPWDGTFSTVGRRSVERFADDFLKSGATDGICLSEAAMPKTAMELESETAGLWFVGRSRLARFLESIDGAMAFGSKRQVDGSVGDQ